MLNKRVVAIIQARFGSTRLPGKVMKRIGRKPILGIIVSRLKNSKQLDDIVIATTTKSDDDVIEVLSNDMDVGCYHGSEEDVLKRYVEAAESFDADVVVRVTSDNPLTDVELMDELIETHLKTESDYTYCDDIPLGVGTEIINTNILNFIDENATTRSEREHVTLYIRSHPKDFKILKFKSDLLNQNIRLTVDTNDDFKLLNIICEELGELNNLKTIEVIDFLKNNPNISDINKEVIQKTPEPINYTKLAIITDGNSKKGLGHVYRSLTLADELKKELDVQIYFLTRSDETIIKKIEDEGYIVINFDDDVEIADILKKINACMIIIERLDFEEDILKTIKKDLNIKIVVMDNLNQENDKYADIIINAVVRSKFKNSTFFDKNIGTEYFYGPKYLVLRDEFNKFKNMYKELRHKIENILIIFGGSDPSNLTSQVLKKLNENDEITLDVVIGPKFKPSILDELSSKYIGKNLNIHHEPKNIAELMYNADIVITSPGMSMFEAILVGTPIILICQNSLQEQYYNSLNYEFFFNKSDIKNLNHYLNDISPIEKRNEIVRYFKKMEVADGRDEIISGLSESIKNVELQNHILNVKNEYENHLLKYDINSPEAVHGSDMKKFNLRFEILTEIADLKNKKVLDFGCGNALLMDFLEQNNINCDYYGWDISDKMIKIAKIRHPHGKFDIVDLNSDDLSNFVNFFDFIIISGVFNGIWDDKPESIHKNWVKETLSILWSLCKNGISVNFLTEYVDWEEKGLYYCRLDDIIPFINKNLSKSFVIKHNYNLFEFTVYIFKESRV